MTDTLTITDSTTGATATVEPFDIAETITPWFPDAPAEVLAAVQQLEGAARRGESTDELAQFLALEVRWNV